jgi:large subunit ribosomal protein L30
MEKIRVKQVRSKIRRPQNQKRTLEALGLRKMNQVVEHDATPTILGMVNKVKHLVSVEEIK